MAEDKVNQAASWKERVVEPEAHGLSNDDLPAGEKVDSGGGKAPPMSGAVGGSGARAGEALAGRKTEAPDIKGGSPRPKDADRSDPMNSR